MATHVFIQKFAAVNYIKMCKRYNYNPSDDSPTDHSWYVQQCPLVEQSVIITFLKYIHHAVSNTQWTNNLGVFYLFLSQTE